MSLWRPFDVADTEVDPLRQFERWYEEAEGQMPDRDAVALSTATVEGRPSSRMVLLRYRGATSVGWYTNYESRKGRELRANPVAALLWYCEGLGRQVRFEGPVTPMSAEQSDVYFAARPRGHQLGAHASAQSSPLSSRGELEEALARAEASFEGRSVPRPAHWGGFSLEPTAVEFFQQREDRLHDRVIYERSASGWSRTRLSP